MADYLGGSAIIRACGRIGKKVRETAQVSLLLGRRKKRSVGSESKLVAVMNRRHPAQAIIAAMQRSSLLSWLYEYWFRLVGGPISAILWLLTPLLGLLAGSMAYAGRFAVAGALLLGLGIAFLLFCHQGTLGDWLESTLIGKRIAKRFTLTQRDCTRSVLIYLALCGVFAGAIGWFLGVKLAVLAAVALAVLPVIFSLPAHWAICLLCGALPIVGTTICWALSFLTVVLHFFGRAYRGEQGRKIDTVDVLLLIFPFLCVITTLFSFALIDSAKVTAMWMGLFLSVFFIRRAINTKKRLLAVLGSLTVGAVLSGLYGLYQYLSGTVNTTWTDTDMFESLSLRVYSTFANPNVYGEFLLLIIPLTAALAMYATGKKRWLMIGVNGLLLVNLVLTYSRGCYVGIALTAVVYLWKYSKKWLAAIAIIAIPLAIVMMPESVVNRIMSIGDMGDSSTSYRVYIYIGTLLMLGRFWFSGLGLGELAFNAVYPYYALTAIIAPHSHSLFFQSVVSFGIVGLVYLLIIWKLYQRRTNRGRLAAGKRDRLLMTGFNTVLWGMMLQSFFDYTWYNYRVFQLFWIIIVLGIAAAEVLSKQSEEEKV